MPASSPEPDDTIELATGVSIVPIKGKRQAQCNDCEWKGPRRDFERDAQLDASNHLVRDHARPTEH